ncbi:uncharacterized protein LOC131026074 [Salvia miltiorrhiza]|uniref:uncharacterized protein LOC131026074 n=1 Tax=Salvia miltiorrhiza TaxID=226208 RepID=UPI0025ACDF8E|nr:uncharacterized protein LOC131026074 [Salvia miltiorrhiza]
MLTVLPEIIEDQNGDFRVTSARRKEYGQELLAQTPTVLEFLMQQIGEGVGNNVQHHDRNRKILRCLLSWTLDILLQILVVFPKVEPLRSKVTSFIHRMVDTLGPSIFPYLPNALGQLLIESEQHLQLNGLSACLIIRLVWFRYTSIVWKLYFRPSIWSYVFLSLIKYLLRGMRGVALCLILLFESLLGFLGLLCSTVVPTAGGLSSRDWISWAFVFQAVVYTGFMTIMLLYSVAATAVLFMYCKALQGELAFEIAEELAQEYIRLPFDDGKLSHVVYVV